MISAKEGEFFTIEGVETFIVRRGTGFPLILFHGGAPGSCSLLSWKLNLDQLAASGLTAIAYDQPGFGYSGCPADLTYEFRVQHAKALIESLGLGEFALLGQSQGAYLAARLAIEHPNARRLVIVSSGTVSPAGSEAAQALAKHHGEELRSYQPSLANMREMSSRTIYNQALVTDDLVQDRYDMSTGRNFEAYQERSKLPPPKPVRDALANLKLRTLIMGGRNDSGVAPERSVLLFELIPNAELHLFDQCAHWVMWDRADRFNHLIADFLASP